MRIVFMGTPDIAATCLKKLLEEQFELVGVYTKPDMPKNRGMKLEMSDVKKVALEAGVPVFQPTTFKDDAVVDELRALQPDPRECPARPARLRPRPVGDPERTDRDGRDRDVYGGGDGRRRHHRDPQNAHRPL